jgi:hypothetical protein
MDKTVYRSKIGATMVCIPLVVIGGVALLMAMEEMGIGLIPLFLASAYIAHLFLNTYYVIEGQKLHIKCGLFFSETIEITSINKIRPTRLMMSAPAVSLDRLEILYNKFDSVLISPKDKEGFVKQLKKINPAIEARLQ